ncbi:MAG: DNA repair protein RecN [Bacteroides sp.]|nr:DNA repair protein RecN [Bacteroides sp.]
MLQSIQIKNYALIDELEINFEQGFSVITGETGAGKSIILGAIGLLLGQRADSRSIKQGASRCIIEGRFHVANYNMESFFRENDLEYEDECILRRELQSSGKSRAFINDTPAPLTLMKELGELLIDVHSQHQNLLLNKEGFQLNVLDIIARNEQYMLRYKAEYELWKKYTGRLKELITEAEKSRADQDFLLFQLEQLEQAGLKEGEQEELEREAETLSHAEEIKAGLFRVENSLASDENGILSVLKENLNILRGLQKVYNASAEFSERLESVYIELKDLVREISFTGERIEYNPVRLEEVSQRLDIIYTLQQKHRVESVPALLALQQEYRDRINSITSLDDQIAETRELIDTQFKRLKEVASLLTEKREKAARQIEQEMVERLALLGMPNIRFRIGLEHKKEPGITGEDAVNFLFSANRSGELQNISSVASGGEIARVMLSIKAMVAGAVKLPTIIFDEIDTGVSGEIASRMADIMCEMGESNNRQVISITHLPQIAGKGKTHYKVYKKEDEEGTHSHICRLSHQQRVEELAHMLSGSVITQAAMNNAKELLQTR